MPRDEVAALSASQIEDIVIERARNRKRPLMPDDETVIRVIVAHFVQDLEKRGEGPPTAERGGVECVVETLVACVGGLEFEHHGEGKGFKLRMVAPDDGMY